MPRSISVNNFTSLPASSSPALGSTALRESQSSDGLESQQRLRVLFWGTSCEFSRIVFAQIMQHSLMGDLAGDLAARVRIEVCAVFLPDSCANFRASFQPDSPLRHKSTAEVEPVRCLTPIEPTDPHELILHNPGQAPDLIQIAQAHSIPVYAIGNLGHPKTADLIELLAVDVACVACYPKRIPSALLSLPRDGFLNVHPSMLPHYRGPAPLFWMMRNGEHCSAGGVTVHWMDANFDTGPIAAQQALDLPDGISGPAAEQRCAMLGGQLLVMILARMSAGKDRLLQPAGGSYFSWPQPSDFELDLTWSARRAFNFMHGTKVWGHPHFVMLDGDKVVLIDALSFTAEKTLDSLFIIEDDKIYIQFAVGVLHARCVP